MNCKKADLMLKTEVTYWMKEHGIDLENLICIDEINVDRNVENFVLVDHHESPYHQKVISVLDHRPYDAKLLLNDECIVNIQEVGSCTTLVMDAIKTDQGIDEIKKEANLLHFLYGPIVLDTINFSKEADKTREMDIEVAQFIERILNIEDIEGTRLDIFKRLVDARADTSSLDSLQILSKDLKIVSNKNSTVRVAMPGLYVFEYPTLERAAENIKAFAERENIDVVVLMGMQPFGNSVKRQLAVINIKNKDLFDS
jgi:exopolyphosphatase